MSEPMATVALDLLRRYFHAERKVIGEFSGDFGSDIQQLVQEIRRYAAKIEMLTGESVDVGYVDEWSET